MVLATIEPWPDLAKCLAVLEPQVAAVGGEIIVGDGHGAALDAARVAASDRLSWIRIPGASVFELRARAVEAARGEIIALTEDHCIVGADWCAQILEAFRRNPDAMGVTGPVLNGSTDQPDRLGQLSSHVRSLCSASQSNAARSLPARRERRLSAKRHRLGTGSHRLDRTRAQSAPVS